MPVKSKEITRENFNNFLEWLSPDREKQGVEYEKVRSRVTIFFTSRRCLHANELTDEVINRLTTIISTENIENKFGYIYGVARNVYLESLRKEKPQVNVEDLNLASEPPPETDFSGECLDKCLQKLSDERRELILEYFSQEKSAKIATRRKTSDELQISQTALRMRVFRIKEQISICVKNCMAD